MPSNKRSPSYLTVLFLLTFGLSISSINSALAQQATLQGSTVKLPLVTVGEVVFSVDLTLVPGSQALTQTLVLGPDSPVFKFDLTAAGEVVGADTTAASGFEGITLTIPSLVVGDSTFLVQMNLVNDAPIQFQLTQFTKLGSTSGADALSFFESSINSQVVNSRCIFCHVDGGIAETTSLIFARSSETSLSSNLEVLRTFAGSRSDALDYLLNKVSGTVPHGGGTQLAVGSTDYNNLQNLMSALITGGSTIDAGSDIDFFTGVELLSPKQTLRRAAIIFAGRAPTAVEYAAVESGDENTLRQSIRSLMRGDNFHEFLTDGANDRLLVRGTQDAQFLNNGGVYPNFSNTKVELMLADRAKGLNWSFDTGRFLNGIDRGLRESPLELIAFVVENDRPYSEILTADYMMTNSVAAFAMDATGSFSEPDDYGNFQPVTLDRNYAWSRETKQEIVVEIQERRIIDPGTLTYDYPHAGVLNTPSFLSRYPTTATNRNRARSRWTFFNFLDTDIEASAPRTNDPVALADTNNPTMNNSNCTVCHATMDPLAGAFQNYNDEGHFRNNGTDSLDNFYKYPPDGKTPYQAGDTWYRDMRVPGFAGEPAPSADNSLQWAVSKIVSDPRFARATVKFWWPSVIGTEILQQPEVQSDANYAAKLMAYDAQSAAVQEMANRFLSSGMNLKDLLVEMAMTPWFRTASVSEAALDPIEAEAHSIANLGSERLLTPEQLARKTRSLTGFTYRNRIDFETDKKQAGLVSEYGLYYGGIDSGGVTTRSKEMTALMSTVAMTHASESSCPIVLREFSLPNGVRALFNDLDPSVTPILEGSESFDLTTSYQQIFTKASTSISLDRSAKNIYVSLNNGWCDWNQATQTCDSTTRIELQSVEIQYPNGSVTKIVPNQSNSSISPDCAWYHNGGVGLCNNSQVEIPLTPTMSGEYKLTATVWPLKEGAANPQANSVNVSVGVNTAESPSASTSIGAGKIRQKLVELHQKLHGTTLDPFSPEINMAYQLFVDSWDELRNLPNAGNYTNVNWGPDVNCARWMDYELGVGMLTDITPYAIEYNDWGGGPYPDARITQEMQDYLQQQGVDPKLTKRAWVTVMTYMLSHYDYLYE